MNDLWICAEYYGKKYLRLMNHANCEGYAHVVREREAKEKMILAPEYCIVGEVYNIKEVQKQLKNKHINTKVSKKYKITKGGSGSGANENAIGIEMTGKDEASAVFVGKVRFKAEQLFGKGASLNAIGTTYGVHIRFPDEKKNRKIAKMLIKVVELEEELIKLKNEY